ncbi:MAG TPA: glycoside hydrolase family 97 protein [Chthonomonadaceae bacterium]|nr:glycoside hydrolase family 97 protein [Chthonomonadaceae bacterium]
MPYRFPSSRCSGAAIISCALGGLAVLGGRAAHADIPRTLTSPDGRLSVQIQMPPPGSAQTPLWSATFQGKPLLTDCRLSLSVADEGDLLAGVRVRSERHRSADKRIRILFGKAAVARDRYREVRFSLETPRRRRVDVLFRCYDDALAFRYVVPKQKGMERLTVVEEGTSFGLAGNPRAYVQYLENYHTSHEHNVTTTPLRDVKADTLLDMPATFAFDDGTHMAITEAALRRYAGMSLMRPSQRGQKTELICRLTPRPDGTKVVRDLPMVTPWRVVMVGDRAGALLESNVIYCLNAPSVLKDTSWIQPGKMTWSWWNGNLYDSRPGPPILSLPMAQKYIDFCARNGILYHSVIADETVTPWYRQSKQGIEPGPDTDVTQVRADLDLEGIRRYAEARGVRLWTWVHQAALRGRVEETFTAFERLGWRGMMVDFFDHDDQEMVELAEEILQAAARHHLLIHFHGVWKPTGMQRTYPNLMNHEGALNLEYLKWSDRCTPEHNLLLAFTRLLAGPMDYHLGGFRAVTRAQFTPHNIAPNVLGTRGHHLAMYVCFDNPQPMIADYPTAYEGQPGFDFLKVVPTWWDETRALVGEVGEVLVTTRRRGRTWYVGGMAAKRARVVELPLSFLGPGRYAAKVWKDAPEAEADPNRLTVETFAASSDETLRVRVAVDGGFVAQFTPSDR